MPIIKAILSEISNKKILVIFVTAFLIRSSCIIAVNIVFDKHFLNQDYEYGVIARSLVSGKGYSVPLMTREPDGTTKEINLYRPTSYHLPFYPIMLAVIYYFVKSSLSIWIVMCIQAVAASLTCIIIYFITLKLYNNQRTAIIAAYIVAVYPTLIFYTARIVPETILIFWLSMMLMFMLILRETPDYKISLTTGILLGITLLTSNVVVPVLPCIVIWLLISWNITWKKRCQLILVMIIAAYAVVSPLLIRNYMVFKEFPLMKTTAGTNLWMGNNPHASGTFEIASGKKIYSFAPESFNNGQRLSETKQDKILYDAAMSYIRQNPMRFVEMFLKKLYYFTWFPPDNLISREFLLNKKIMMIPYGVMLISFIAGIFLSLKKYPKDVFLLCSIIFSVAVLYSIFVVGHPRYRMTIEPYMIILSSYFVSFLIDKFSLMSKYRR